VRKTELYMIINERELAKLEERVQAWMDSGWLPVGGLTVYSDHQGSLFLQAIYNAGRLEEQRNL
jgi:hypothetical protein